MVSFEAKLKEKQDSHAYVLGVQAYRAGSSMLGPYERGSPLDEEWVDGYLDAMFIYEL